MRRGPHKGIVKTLLMVTMLSSVQSIYSQNIRGAVRDIDTNEPIPEVTVKLTQKNDTSVYSYITTGVDGLYETIAPVDTTVGIDPKIASAPVWLNYTPDHIEVRIADDNLQAVGSAEMYMMNGGLIATVDKERDGQYSLIRINRNLLGKKPLGVNFGAYGGVFTENGFRFNTDVKLGVGGLTAGPVEQGSFKSTGDIEDYIFSITHDGYENYEEDFSIDMEGINAVTSYLKKIIPSYIFDLSGQLLPGGDSLLIVANGIDTLYNDIANPDFAAYLESEDDTLEIRATAENDSMYLDSLFLLPAGTYADMQLQMKEKPGEVYDYFFGAIFDPQNSNVVAYIRNELLDDTDNDTLFAGQSLESFYVLHYASSDTLETFVVEMSHPDHGSKIWVDPFEPGDWSVTYDLRD